MSDAGLSKSWQFTGIDSHTDVICIGMRFVVVEAHFTALPALPPWLSSAQNRLKITRNDTIPFSEHGEKLISGSNKHYSTGSTYQVSWDCSILQTLLVSSVRKSFLRTVRSVLRSHSERNGGPWNERVTERRRGTNRSRSRSRSVLFARN